MGRVFKNVGLVVSLTCWCLGTSSYADFISFDNPSEITIPSSGLASPYGSPIVVSGVTGTIENITLSLNGLSHTWADDLGAVVVAPSGTSVMLFSGPGGFFRVSNLSLTFDDNAGAPLPDEGQLVSGTFQPGQEQYDDFYPAPGPGGKLVDTDPAPWSYAFAPLFSQDPNGTWNLFVLDSGPGDSGSISGGWGLTFQVTAVPEPSCLGLSALLAWCPFLRRRS